MQRHEIREDLPEGVIQGTLSYTQTERDAVIRSMDDEAPYFMDIILNASLGATNRVAFRDLPSETFDRLGKWMQKQSREDLAKVFALMGFDVGVK